MRKGIETVSFPLLDVRIFDEIIDVRAPIEFKEDHINGAINLPVLSDEQRERIGTQYTQESAFEAQKAGAALVSKNIGSHLEEHFSKKPKGYRPLIYCFRGGQRSRSLGTVLAEIGWPVAVLEGGYKAYRKHVRVALEERSPTHSFHVINGLTGSGKTLVLQTLELMGAQVLDLEGLANHKGSVFGEDPDHPQPSQKRFDSLIYDHLCEFDPSQPIYVEAESARIGRLNLPNPLRKELGESPVTEMVVPLEARVEYLHGDYEPWLSKPDLVLETIDRLKAFHSREIITLWRNWCTGGQWKELIASLLTEHYDQHYGTDGQGNYRVPDRQVELYDLSEASIRRFSSELLEAKKPVPAG